MSARRSNTSDPCRRLAPKIAAGLALAALSALLIAGCGGVAEGPIALFYDSGEFGVLVVSPDPIECGSMAQNDRQYFSCDSPWLVEIDAIRSADMKDGADLALDTGGSPVLVPTGYFSSSPCAGSGVAASGKRLRVHGAAITVEGFDSRVPTGNIPLVRCKSEITCGVGGDQCISNEDCCNGTCSGFCTTHG